MGVNGKPTARRSLHENARAARPAGASPNWHELVEKIRTGDPDGMEQH